MIAAFPTGPTLHVVHEIVREGFKVKAYGYCGATSSAADGTFQVPDWVFTSIRSSFVGPVTKTEWKVCQACSAAVRMLIEPPR